MSLQVLTQKSREDHWTWQEVDKGRFVLSIILNPIDFITKDVYKLQKMIKEKKESLQKTKNKEKNKEHEQEQAREKEKEWVFLMNKTYNCILILYFSFTGYLRMFTNPSS